MHRAPRSGRSSFLSLVRTVLFVAIVATVLVTLPLRRVYLAVNSSSSSNSSPTHPASRTAPTVAVDDVVGDEPVISVPLGMAPLETTPELVFRFPTDQEVESLFRNAQAQHVANQTHVYPLMQTAEVFTGQYRNPYHAMNVTRRPCRGGAHAHGRWVFDPTLSPRYGSYGEILGCCQRGYEKLHGPGAVRPETKYRWEADACDLHSWDEELFCRALRGRDIMIAGDSLNDHWHASLFYLLGGNKDIYKREGTVRGKRACGTHAICGKYYPKPLRLYFLTNQLLQEERRLFRNYKWWKYIRGYPILVLNAGSWMRDPADETRVVSDDEYFGHMRKAYAIVKNLRYNGTIIWRTTYQGHPYCWKYQKPLTEELRPEQFPRVAPYLRYRWWAIPHRNNFTTQLWRQAGAHVLDVTRITNLMPLGHLGQNHPKFEVRNVTDCLHYCSPGPVYDTWSMLLMNLLLGNLED